MIESQRAAVARTAALVVLSMRRMGWRLVHVLDDSVIQSVSEGREGHPSPTHRATFASDVLKKRLDISACGESSQFE